MGDRLIEVKDLKTHFFSLSGVVRAVDGVTLHVNKGETLALVGESGSGKSVTALSIMRLLPSPPAKIVDGEIDFAGENLLSKSDDEIRAIRGNEISMIFQEPMTSLNPVFTCGDQISESIRLHQGLDRADAMAQAVDMLRKVGIPSPEIRVKEYPHQLSGGMRQRVMIAMALSCNPRLLIADEPTTALDVTSPDLRAYEEAQRRDWDVNPADHSRSWRSSGDGSESRGNVRRKDSRAGACRKAV